MPSCKSHTSFLSYYQTCVMHVDYLYNVGHRKLSYQLAAKYRNVPQTMNKVLATR